MLEALGKRTFAVRSDELGCQDVDTGSVAREETSSVAAVVNIAMSAASAARHSPRLEHGGEAC